MIASYISRKFEFMYKLRFPLITLLMSLAACTTDTVKQPDTERIVEPPAVAVSKPDFNEDSAYAHVKFQCDQGPRIPGTKAHARVVEYFTQQLKTYTDTVIVQQAPIRTFDGKQFNMKNIVASFNPDVPNRVLLCAHYDTRPWADGDTTDKYQPFISANDGPSGAGVLLEVARQLQLANTNMGIDIVLFDMEDYGQEQDDNRYPQQNNTWCLGSQYWARNPHKAGYTARYGILLDMVGGKDAVFPKEGTSVQYAYKQQESIWRAAAQLGYTNFTQAQTNPTIDDHLYINELAGIPTVDIVHYLIEKSNYPDYHHSQNDNMQVIDKNTLKQVGTVVLYTVMNNMVE